MTTKIDQQELEIRSLALQMAVRRMRGGKTYLSTFEWVFLFEKYLQGENPLQLDEKVKIFREQK